MKSEEKAVADLQTVAQADLIPLGELAVVGVTLASDVPLGLS
jgi:hypothetical protein